MFTVSVPTTAAVTSVASWKIEKGKLRVGGMGGWGNFKFEISNFKWKGWAGVVWLLGFGVVIVLTARGRKKSEERCRLRGVGALAIAAAILCVACGGGGAATSDPAVTLPGTYMNAITVTATTGTGTSAATRTAQLTLIVQ